MYKKSLLFGIGVGILVMALISFGAYVIQRGAFRNDIAELQGQLDDAAEWLLTQTPSNAPYPAYFSDDDVLARARELGMVFADELKTDIEAENEADSENNNAEYYSSDDENGYDGENGEANDVHVEADQPDEFVRVYILLNTSSADIAQLLQDSGVVANAATFAQFVIENGYDRRLRAGPHYLPINGDFYEIVDIIMNLR